MGSEHAQPASVHRDRRRRLPEEHSGGEPKCLHTSGGARRRSAFPFSAKWRRGGKWRVRAEGPGGALTYGSSLWSCGAAKTPMSWSYTRRPSSPFLRIPQAAVPTSQPDSEKTVAEGGATLTALCRGAQSACVARRCLLCFNFKSLGGTTVPGRRRPSSHRKRDRPGAQPGEVGTRAHTPPWKWGELLSGKG